MKQREVNIIYLREGSKYCACTVTAGIMLYSCLAINMIKLNLFACIHVVLMEMFILVENVSCCCAAYSSMKTVVFD